MVDSKLEVVGCNRIEGEDHGPISQQIWVLILALLELTSLVTLASQASLGNKPICPVWPLCSSNETKPGRQPARVLAFRGCPHYGEVSGCLQSHQYGPEVFLLSDAVALQFWAWNVVSSPQLYISLWLCGST